MTSFFAYLISLALTSLAGSLFNHAPSIDSENSNMAPDAQNWLKTHLTLEEGIQFNDSTTLSFLLAMNDVDTMGMNQDGIKVPSTSAYKYISYQYRNDSGYALMVQDCWAEDFSDYIIYDFLVKHGVFRLIKKQVFIHGNYACCWDWKKDMGLHKLSNNVFTYKRCGTGSGYCSSAKLVLHFGKPTKWPNYRDDNYYKLMIHDNAYSFDPEGVGAYSSSSQKIRGDSLFIEHYHSQYNDTIEWYDALTDIVINKGLGIQDLIDQGKFKTDTLYELYIIKPDTSFRVFKDTVPLNYRF